MVKTQKFDLDTDTTLGGNNASDYIVPSQKAIKSYVDNHSGGGGTATDVQINGTSITSSNVANIVTNSIYNSSTNKIATMSDVFSRNIGEIVQSTIPLTDAGLHLLDGSEIVNMGIYSNFFTKIQQLYNSGNYDYLFTTASDWQTSVDTYGVCGKFVYTAGLQIIKLPKIIGFTESTIDVTTLGDLTEAGLPDHLHVGQYKNPGTSGGNANGVGSGSGWFGWANRNTGYASANNPIYGNSDTVQPQSVKVLYYIVIANSTKTDIEVDIDEVVTDLNNKADKDLSNLTSSNSRNFDGQWVNSYNVVWTSGTAGDFTVNLGTTGTNPKNYLPQDNYSYLVQFIAFGNHNKNTSTANLHLLVGNDKVGLLASNSSTGYANNSFFVVVDSSRSFDMNITIGFNSFSLTAIGYRRIGTNT